MKISIQHGHVDPVFIYKGRGAIRANFGPMLEINFVVITI